MIHRLDVETASHPAYPVWIGEGAMDQLSGIAQARFPRGRAVVISDETVWRLHGETLTRTLQRAGVTPDPIVLPPGEGQKSWDRLGDLVEALLARGLERSESLVAFGGGVIGDLAGFAAAILKRGVPFVQIPTTLLAQVDSSVGGKTGVNAASGKNLIGAFHQPEAVLADTRFLATLPERELKGGYAEVLKYALIRDADFFDWLEAKGEAVLACEPEACAEAVRRSIAWKAEIVAQDERETGVRALLNLGHTFGHAAEALAGYDGRLIHGEAVAWGLAAAARYSARLGKASDEDADRIAAHLTRHGLPASLAQLPGGPFAADSLLQAMNSDKKARGGQIVLVVMNAIGEATIEPVENRDALRAFLEDETKQR